MLITLFGGTPIQKLHTAPVNDGDPAVIPYKPKRSSPHDPKVIAEIKPDFDISNFKKIFLF